MMGYISFSLRAVPPPGGRWNESAASSKIGGVEYKYGAVSSESIKTINYEP